MPSDVNSWRSTRRSLTTLTRAVAAILLVLGGLLGISQSSSAADGEFVNISTRSFVGTGAEAMIGGLIIHDGPRRVLIQARGQELANDGISNALADPVLTVIRQSDGMELMVNDNWEDSQGQLVSDLWGGNPNLAAGSLSSAVVLTLDPGIYTAKVDGKNGTAGVAILEVYGIDSAGADGKFVNLSTRALVGTGVEVMIGGFIIEDGARRVLIQARGPELANDGISNLLADPVLTVIRQSDGMELMVNDNWEDSQGQLVSDLWGGSPNLAAGSLSSAVVLTLDPGRYTAKVDGKNGTAGVAILEVYGIDSPDVGSPDREALTALYNATDGANWVNKDNWLSDAPLDEWHGVTVDDNGRVVELRLSENQLSGPIPPELGKLTSLTLLNLGRNALSGSIPPELGNLTNLLTLDLAYGDNALTGVIPPELGNLANLTWLRLAGNRLSGSIPAELGQLGNLERLDLDHNELTGSIPSWLGNLTNLHALDLASNRLSGSIPPELGNLTNLRSWLYLYDNQLSGAIPPELGNLNNLEELFLYDNELSGPIPPELGSLSNLTRLYLFNNSDLSGSLPSSFTDLGALVDLYLFGTELCAPTDDAFQMWLQGIPNKPGVVNCGSIAGDRAALVALYNATDGANWTTITNWLSNAPLDQWFGVTVDENGRVIELSLDDNWLNGSIPAELGNLTRLERLWLYDNQLSGPIPPELGNLANLETLNLRTNQLTGAIPAALGNLANLEYLGLHDNQLTGTIPATLGQLANLKTLGLHTNQLSGSIPTELGALANLEGLYLHENQLSGSIPAQLGNLNNLDTLALYDNQLTGPIPSELGKLANLEYLGLQANQLSGPIPAQLGQLANLQRLVLQDNQLRGQIPAELGSLINLEGLWLDDNQLSEAVPAELGNLSNLESMYLNDNSDLSGSIPGTFTGLGDLVDLYLSGTGLCAPTDNAFQSWLQGVPNKPGVVNCGSIVGDRAALVALYNATDGENWTNNNNWLSNAPLGDWDGVTVNDNGRVIDLSLPTNQLSGSVPPELGILSSLLELDLSNNADLAGPLPGSLTQLKKLGELDLDGTGLCAPVDEAFQAWLGGVYIWGVLNNCASEQSDRDALVALYNATDGSNWTNSENWLSDAPLGDWHGVSTNSEGRVDSLILDENMLLGNIPPELGNLSKLTLLDLGNNMLSGSIPPELGNLTSLRELDLSLNGLSGTIPSMLGDLANLEDLDLSLNELSGAIPSELGDLTNLRALDLHYNQLSGSIPPQLGRLSQLTQLLLFWNSDLSGTLPDSYTSLRNLGDLDLSGTQLCAPADDAFQAWLEGIPNKLGVVNCVDGDGGGMPKIYWGDFGTGKIQRANLDGTGVQDLVAGLSHPVGIALDPGNGKVYWADYGFAKIQRANLDGSGVEDLITGSANQASGLALDLGNGKIYWASAYQNKIQRANLDGTGIEDIITGLSRPIQLALDLAGSKIYWASAATTTIQRANLDGTGIEDLVSGLGNPASGVALDLFGGKIYWIVPSRNKIQRANLDGSGVEDLIIGLSGPEGLALDLGADKIYWTETESKKIRRANLDGTGVEDVISGLGNPLGIALDTSTTNQSSNVRRLTNNSANDGAPAWSPDGSKIAFGSNRDGNFEIYVMNADGSGVMRLTNHSAADYEPAWSPDGTKIAFRSSRDGRREIYVMNADGSGVTGLTNHYTGDHESPTWSLDGSKVAFNSDRESPTQRRHDIYVLNVDGSGVTRLTNVFAFDIQPAWSPDGTKIAFQSNRDGNDEIYVMNADGSGVTRLTNLSSSDQSPVWSPDGTRIAFMSSREGNPEIYVMNADGAGVRQLTTNIARSIEPAWSPDGARIAFSSNLHGNYEVYVIEIDSAGTGSQDRNALVALYNATDGANWTRSDNWGTTAPLDQWYGVTVDGNGRVIELGLNNNRLSGSIPTDLSNLTNLQRLVLHNNQLSGVIPEDLGNLTNLQTIYLGGTNQISGCIPNGMQGVMDSDLSTLGLPYCDSIASDRAALVALYNTTNGVNWTNSDNWLTDEPLGKWYGVSTDSSGRVVGLYLSGRYDPDAGSFIPHGLIGPIPPEIGQLDKLENLLLGNNKLSGYIPPELGSLAKLRRLNLRSNALSGPIPPELGNLTELLELDLSANVGIDGEIPPELGNLSQLVELHLWKNKLQGRIPSELGRLTELTNLWLEANYLEGEIPPEIGNLTQLRSLGLNLNTLNGPLPASLLRLEQLAEFAFSDNDGLCAPGTVAFAEWLEGMEHKERQGSFCNEQDIAALESLYRSANGGDWANSAGWLDGPALDHWHGVVADSLGRVVELDLSGNGLAGRLSAGLAKLDRITSLRIGGNALEGPMPLGLASLSLQELHYLDTRLCVPANADFQAWLNAISSHEGTGARCELSDRDVLEALYEATDGWNWSLNDNWLTDAPLGDWHGIEVDGTGRVIAINLGFNNLTGPIPAELGDLVELQRLFLNGNYLHGEIPPQLGNLTSLRELVLSWSELEGEIPPQLGELRELSDLTLSRNYLRGGIPREIGNLTGLKELRLMHNNLSGGIPPEIGNLTFLELLWLGDNELSGRIPPELGQLANLRSMYLFENGFEGGIPPELGNLKKLWLLNVAGNRLTGQLPPELGAMSGLNNFLVGNNMLSGPLPGELGDLTNLQVLSLYNNPGLSGPLPESLIPLRLTELIATGTALCVPDELPFRDWLRSIGKRRVPICGVKAEAYLTQAAQSREYLVPLVAGESAFLRVFVTSLRETAETLPPVRATFFLNGVEAHVVEIPAGTVTIPTEVREGELDRSVNAEIPAMVIQPGLEMVLEIDPSGTLDPSLGVSRRIPAEGREVVEVAAMPQLNLTLLPFVWTGDNDRRTADLVEELHPDHELFWETNHLLPVADFQIMKHEPVLTDSKSGFDLIREVNLIRTMEGGTGHWKGLMYSDSPPGGIAHTPGKVSFSKPNSALIAHELGHNFSLNHAPCGTENSLDPSFPQPDGRIGVWGYDPRDGGSLVPPTFSDLMGYCSHKWISDYHFSNAFAYRLSDEGTSEATRVSVQTLLVSGHVEADGSLSLDPAFVVNASAAVPDVPGPFMLAGRRANGSELFSIAFDMPEVAHGEGRSGFVFALPVQPGWAEELAVLMLLGPRGSVTLDKTTDQPMTILRNPQTGQVRAILRDLPLEARTPGAGTARVPADNAEQSLAGLEVLFSRGIPDASAWRR